MSPVTAAFKKLLPVINNVEIIGPLRTQIKAYTATTAEHIHSVRSENTLLIKSVSPEFGIV